MLKSLIQQHKEQYPALQAEDIVKAAFQAMRGCGHLLADESIVAARIAREMEPLTANADEPLTVGLGEHYVRLNLRAAKHAGLTPAWIARLMGLSVASAPVASVAETYKAILALAESYPETKDAILAAAAPLAADETWLPSHSAVYHANYAPAYRVIARQVAPVLDVLCAATVVDKPCVRIVIDGCCGSGKSTLANLLATVLGAPVVSMDCFFTPHAQKTPERLSLPGGNADIERFRDEFLAHHLRDGHGAYRPYLCHLDAYGEAVEVPASRFLIVEGTYALHPLLDPAWDVRVFLRVPADVQQARILKRNGPEMLERFVNTWIPLEEAYFAAFSLPDISCLCPRQPDQF